MGTIIPKLRNKIPQNKILSQLPTMLTFNWVLFSMSLQGPESFRAEDNGPGTISINVPIGALVSNYLSHPIGKHEREQYYYVSAKTKFRDQKS